MLYPVRKKEIIITQTHQYLFWSAGIYYIWPLCRKYNIILIVDNSYKENSKFIDICKHMDVKECFYIDNLNKRSIKSHRKHYRALKKIILHNKPDIILHYDYIDITNMYLFSLCRKVYPDTVQFVIATANPSTIYTSQLLKYIRKNSVNKYKISKVINVKILLLFLEWSRIIYSYITNKILPLLSNDIPEGRFSCPLSEPCSPHESM